MNVFVVLSERLKLLLTSALTSLALPSVVFGAVQVRSGPMSVVLPIRYSAAVAAVLLGSVLFFFRILALERTLLMVLPAWVH